MRGRAKTHQEWLLGSFALLLLVLIAAFFVWGIRTLITTFDAVARLPEGVSGRTSFDLNGAQELKIITLTPTQGIPQATSTAATTATTSTPSLPRGGGR